MLGAMPRRSGLPYVPSATADEPLGAWLLRIAELYGLSLQTLLARLDALKLPGPLRPPWFALSGDVLDWTALAGAFRSPEATIAAMAAPHCHAGTSELGTCLRCLAETVAAGEPRTWSRRWMHPFATVCQKHHAWLAPVACQKLREVKNAGALVRLADRLLGQPDVDAGDEHSLMAGAAWLQQFFVTSVRPPDWCDASPPLLAQVVSMLARVMMAECATDYVRRLAPSVLDYVQARGGYWHLASVALDEVSSHGPRWIAVPHKLNPRRLLLGVIGCFLTQPAHARGDMALSPLMVRELLRSPCRSWPSHTLAWVSADAKVLRRACKNGSTELITKFAPLADRPGANGLVADQC